MATSGTVDGNNVDGDPGVYVDWQLASQNVSGNYSVINWQAGWQFSAVGCRGLRLGFASIDGVVVYDDNDGGDGVHGFVSGHNHRPKLQTASGSIQLNHDANGQKSFTIQCEMYGWAGGPVRSAGSGTFSLPDIVRPPTAPGTPTATRVNDGQINLSWTNNSSAHHEYASQKVLRSTDGGSYATIATVAGSATSFSDTTVSANNRYSYKIQAVNAAGTATSGASSDVYTTPAAPSSLSASKLANGNIRLTWTNNVSYGNTAYTTRIEESQGGGAYTEIASVSGGVSTWDHVSPNPAVTHRYRVRARSNTGSLNSGYSNESNLITLLATANPPANLAPSGVAVDADEDITLSWQHNPADGTPQTSYRIRYEVDGGSTVTIGPVTSEDSEHILPAATLSNGHTITWRVATAGQNGTLSADSATASFTTSARPTVTLIDPGGPVSTSTLTAQWVYFQAQGSPQATWQAVLYDQSDNIIESRSGTTESQVTFATPVADGATYTVRVTVTSAAGLASVEDEQTYQISYLPPAAVHVAATYDAPSGSMVLTITGDGPTPGVTEAIDTVDVQRSIDGGEWVTVISGLRLTDEGDGLRAVVVDTTPTIAGTNTYRAIAYSALPSSATSADETVVTAETDWSFLSTGPGFTQILRMKAKPTFKASVSRRRALHHFAGRSKPVQLAGEATTLELSVSGTLTGESSTPEEFEAVATTPGVVLWRDPTGRRVFGVVGKVQTSRATHFLAEVSFDLTEVDYAE